MSKSRPAPGTKHRAHRIRPATAADVEAFEALVNLAAPTEVDGFEEARLLAAAPATPPLTHGLALCLVAALPDGTVAGALLGEPPVWLYEHPAVDTPRLHADLQRRIGWVVAMATSPEHRNSGIATALLREARNRYRRAGFGLLGLYHEPELEDFYRTHGYTSATGLIANLPHALLCLGKVDHLLTALSPLEPRVTVRQVPGHPYPVIGGLLPGTAVPHGVYFDGHVLRGR